MRESLINKRATLYMARNVITDDFYIGVTCKKINLRRNEHLCAAKNGKEKSIFYKAIRKYGVDKFIWTKIGSFPTYQEGLDAEIFLIEEMNPKYNITKGGEGVLGIRHSPESIEKMAAKKRGVPSPQRGRKRTEEQKENIKRGLVGKQRCRFWLGKKRSKETIEKISKTKTGNVIRPSNEIIEKLKKNGAISAAKRKKPIICINDGNRFDSVAECAKFY